MRAFITVREETIPEGLQFRDRLYTLSTQVSKEGGHLRVSPRPGMLFELLNFLRENQIPYTTAFDTTDEMHS